MLGWPPYTSLYKAGQRGAGFLSTRRNIIGAMSVTTVPEPDLADTRPPTALGRARRPVILATLSVRIDAHAERIAFASALESGAKLILANMLELHPYPLTVVLARDCLTLPHEEDLEAVRATAARAASAGIATELLRIRSPRPTRALLELVRERDAGLLVLGPDRQRVARRRLRAAARAVRREAPCLVWVGDE
jgi:nucleotide-binding universal stress UspA family protein